MAHHVRGGQLAERDVVDPAQHVLDLAQPGLGGTGQVHLGDVTGHHDARAEAQPGEEHLHLLGRGVLGLVQDHEGVVERAPSHVGERCHLDAAGLHEPRNGLGVHHVVQRVVERAQVRVDLVVERSGQEPQPLPRLDRGPREDDPVDLLGLQRAHGLGHGQVGLAGARGADAEHHGVLVDRVHVGLLVHRLGADGAPARGQDARGQRARGPQVLGVTHHAGHAHHGALGDLRAAQRHGQQLLQQRRRQAGVRHGPLEHHVQVPHGHPHGRELLLEQPQGGVGVPQGTDGGVPVRHVHAHTGGLTGGPGCSGQGVVPLEWFGHRPQPIRSRPGRGLGLQSGNGPALGRRTVGPHVSPR